MYNEYLLRFWSHESAYPVVADDNGSPSPCLDRAIVYPRHGGYLSDKVAWELVRMSMRDTISGGVRIERPSFPVWAIDLCRFGV